MTCRFNVALALATFAPWPIAAAQVVDTLHSSTPSLADELHCSRSTAAPVAAGPARQPRVTDTMYYVPPPSPRPAIDTTIVLDIDRRDWHRDSWSGGIALGTDDLLHTTSRYSACAGASVSLESASVALRGVRGIVRLHADFHALETAAGRGRGAQFMPDRSSTTPPAAPPRR